MKTQIAPADVSSNKIASLSVFFFNSESPPTLFKESVSFDCFDFRPPSFFLLKKYAGGGEGTTTWSSEKLFLKM